MEEYCGREFGALEATRSRSNFRAIKMVMTFSDFILARLPMQPEGLDTYDYVL